MSKWYFIIDVSKCWDCNNCLISCKDEHVDNEWPGYTLAQPLHGHRWMDVLRTERGQYPLIDVAYRPTPCMQCQDAPCVKASGGAITRRPDGIVLIDQEKAKGRQELAKSCPYGAIYWNEEKRVPQKCTMCAHLLDDGWKQTRCSQACFAGALKVVKLEDGELARMIQEEGLEQLHPELGTKPNVYYKNLYRFNKVFIAGSAAVKNGEIFDCAKGAKASLYRGKDKIAEAVADAFGDFRFDRLPEGSGVYAVDLELDGRRSQRVEVELGQSRNLGTLLV
ncbi:4Fe-4S dicluster domain-containing protein [Holophaga foetida]|uniref:4Fe-4S dicluster domain-containing protein n=1 Tax=Holophaga foetida TaxID=35839 RepID=UPI0002473F50|nr:4Fe-4S dicluster domain-containing protein [Holophaga foetida]